MILQFAHKEIKEFANGTFHVKNDGKPFEVTDLLGNELLKAQMFLRNADGKKSVNVFEVEKPKKAKKETEGDK